MVALGMVQVGDEIRLRGEVFVVAALTAQSVDLVDAVGTSIRRPLPQVTGDPTLELVAGARVRLHADEVFAGVPDEVLAEARYWERHLRELLTGRRPDAGTDALARPEYDPMLRSLRQREIAKVEEMRAEGRSVSLTTLQRQRRAYQKDGLRGVIDGRYLHDLSDRAPGRRVDDRVVAVVRELVDAETDASTGTVSRLRRRVEKALADEFGAEAPTMPSQATFYRLVQRLSAGRHTFGSARTRRSLAKRPEAPFGMLTVARPGEMVEIDSTPLDVRVVLDDGTVDRVELTAMVDNATRSIPAAVLRPTTKAVDAALLLARALTPEAMRPGWSDALRMSRSALPHRSMTDVDQRLLDAAARPVIAPETIVCDHGKAYLSQTFRRACDSLGISLQPAHPDTPTDKPKVERTLQSVATLFAQHVAGYVGSSVERRGLHAEKHAVWSLIELQAMLDEWIVAVWQHRAHDGLRDPVTPGESLSPNEKYAALVAFSGYVPVPMSADDYIELLPAMWRTINSYGVRVNNRTYDARALNRYRRQDSGVAARNGRWEVHHDPHDVSRIWVRNHHDDGWIMATWTHLRTVPVPFGEAVWRQARAVVAGRDRATEAEIAAAADELLTRAGRGPQPAAGGPGDRRAARARSTPVSVPATITEEPAEEPATPGEAPVADMADEDDLADVVPLPVFDARKEAQRWRI